jgi:hypothetical protein
MQNQNNVAMTKLTVEEYNKFFRNKKDVYEHCVRNGFHLPSQKSNVCTEEWLTSVRDGKAWCPRSEEIRCKPCPRPPNKSILLQKFWNFVTFHRLQMPGIDEEKHRFDKRWLLDVLGTFVPNDEIFGKAYMPPVKGSRLDQIKVIDVPTWFLEGLP